ncbi:MAG: hypothetical protein NT023_08900 [Armatimonadetes bacterium]|nr:hypothetical protein [Armatimonadota bacterium]
MQVEEIEQLVLLVRDSKIRELTLREGSSRITIRQPNITLVPHYEGDPLQEAETAEQGTALTAYEESAEGELDDTVFITSPCVGFFHHGKKPIGVGSSVIDGQVVGVIEAMKILNEVRAPQSGIVREVLIEEGLPAEYGQPLFIIEATA